MSPRVLLFDGTSLFCLESNLYLKKRSTHSLTEHRVGQVSHVLFGEPDPLVMHPLSELSF